MTFKDSNGQVIDTYDLNSASAAEFKTLPLQDQDPWESRKAWDGVISSINQGDMKGVAEHKNKLENAQRELRKKSKTSEENWRALFFRKEDSDAAAQKLFDVVGEKMDPESTCGIWKYDAESASKLERPWRADLTPFG